MLVVLYVKHGANLRNSTYSIIYKTVTDDIGAKQKYVRPKCLMGNIRRIAVCVWRWLYL